MVAKLAERAKQVGERTLHLHRLNIGLRLTLCFVFIILAMLVGNAILLWQLHRIRAQAERLSGVDQEFIAVLLAHTDLISLYERLDDLAHSEDTGRLVREVEPLRKALFEDTQRSINALSRVPPEVQLDPTILPTFEAIQSVLPEQLEAITALAKSRDWEAVRLRLTNKVRPLESLTSTLVKNVDRQVAEERAQAVLNIDRAQRRILLIVPTTAVLTLLFAAFLGLAITRSITQPLRRLMEGSKALGQGEFQHRVAISGEDELAHLGRVFNDTAERLRDLYATLQANEDRLRLVINTIPAHVWSALPDGSVDFISERWLESTGSPVEDGLGWDWRSVVHPDDLPRFVDEWHTALAAAEPMESEARLRRTDGQYRWWLIRNVPLRDHQGNIVKWYGTSIDIEDRKRAEDALRRSRAYLTEAEKLNHTGSFGWDLSSREIYWSEETFQIFEFEPSSNVTFERISERTHPEDRLALRELIQRVTRERTEFDLEHRLLMPDGSVKHLHVVVRPSTDEWGRFEFVGAVTDITERKRAESRLNTQYAVTRILSESASIDDATPRIVQSICECLDWKIGEIWRVDGETKRLTFVKAWHLPSGDLAKFASESLGLTFPPGTGLPGRVCETRKPLWIRNLAEDSNFLRSSLAAKADLHCGFGFPILLGEETLGVMVFFSREVREPDPDVLEMMANIGSQIGQFIERRRAEEELRRSEFYLAEGQRLAHSGSWSFAPSGICDYWSQELYQILGFDPAKGIPTIADYVSIVHPLDREFVQRTINQMVAEGIGCDVKKRIVRTDGEVRVIRCVGIPVHENGVVSRFIGTLMDITDQESMIQELRRREGYLAEAQKLSHTGSFGWDVSSGEIYWSRETFEIFEYEPEAKVTIELVLQRTHPENKSAVQELIERVTRERTEFDLEHRLLMPDGSVRYLHVVGRPSTDEWGRFEFVGAVTDITERKRAEADLQNAFDEIRKLKDRLQKENIALREEIDKASMFEDIIGESPALQAVLERVAKVAPTDSTVLITGETGTGKELIARAIHKRSQRSSEAFVSVNCAATPATLIASELFGHEKGAFTGALQRRLGRFELAEGGTIFLDEVGELPAETQIALLRVLQEREFQRVGGTQLIHADVRVIAATNRDLESAIAGGAFRKDLFYRLSVFPIEIPPLRERREDIHTLIEYFIHRYSKKAGKKIGTIEKKTLELLESYAWPGNIRELQNVIERSVILSETGLFSVDPSWLSLKSSSSRQDGQPLSKLSATQEREAIERALAASGGRVSGPSGAAAQLNIPASTLESKIRALKINKFRFKTV